MMKRRTRVFTRTSAAIAATTATVAAVALINTDNVIENSFASALRAKHVAGVRSGTTSAPAGSEEFWLEGRRLAGTTPVAWARPAVVVGEKIAVASGERELALEVVDVREIAGAAARSPVTRIDPGNGDGLILVTCRVVGGGQEAALVSMAVDPAASLPWRSLSKPSHAL